MPEELGDTAAVGLDPLIPPPVNGVPVGAPEEPPPPVVELLDGLGEMSGVGATLPWSPGADGEAVGPAGDPLLAELAAVAPGWPVSPSEVAEVEEVADVGC